jgi:adenylylsulfate kinase-like enzyme
MKNEKQNTLLIHGISGSGKTTLTRFIERKYLKIWKKKGK